MVIKLSELGLQLWYILMSIKRSQLQLKRTKIVRMNFDLSDDLRKEFKAKLAKEGKTSREVIVDFIKEYIKK